MSGPGCGVPSWDLSQHQYLGGGAYQSLKLQFGNSSSSPEKQHAAHVAGRGPGRQGTAASVSGTACSLPGDVG